MFYFFALEILSYFLSSSLEPSSVPLTHSLSISYVTLFRFATSSILSPQFLLSTLFFKKVYYAIPVITLLTFLPTIYLFYGGLGFVFWVLYIIAAVTGTLAAKGYLFKEKNSNFTNVKFSNHIGVKVGNVFKTNDNYIYIKLEEPLVNGDSIRIVGKKEDAVTISEMYLNNCLVKQANIGDVVRIRCHKELSVNSIVLKTSNIKLMDEINNYQEKKMFINGVAYINQNNKLVLKLQYKDISIEEESSIEIEPSDNINFKSRIYDQLNKTNSTIYNNVMLLNKI